MPTLVSCGDDPRILEWSCNTFVGRRMAGGLSVDFGRPVDRQISSVHAAVTWDRSSQRWHICDLGSTNGTWVGGKVIDPGCAHPLSNDMQIAFGDSVWRIEDLRPPPVTATSAHGDLRIGQDGVLLLPDERNPELTLHRAADGWWYRPWDEETPLPADTEGSARLTHGQQLVAGGIPWRIAVPADRPLITDMGTLRSRRLADYRLVLDVSADFETIVATLIGRGDTVNLAARRYHELWWLLALQSQEQRRADGQPAEAGADPEAGWITTHALLKQMGPEQSMGNLNVWVHRSRKILAEKGFKDAEGFIERRHLGQPELRLMALEVEIRQR